MAACNGMGHCVTLSQHGGIIREMTKVNVGCSKQEVCHEDPITASGGPRVPAVAVRVKRAESNLSFNLLEPWHGGQAIKGC